MIGPSPGLGGLVAAFGGMPSQAQAPAAPGPGGAGWLASPLLWAFVALTALLLFAEV